MFKKSNFFLTILILILGLALNSCSSTKGLETASNNQVLKNTKWELKSLNKKDIKKVEKVAIINFEKENKVFGNLGCNSFFGKVDIKPNNINISKVGSTMMMCSDMSVERDYMEVLNTVTTYKIDGNSLIFFDKNNKKIVKSYLFILAIYIQILSRSLTFPNLTTTKIIVFDGSIFSISSNLLFTTLTYSTSRFSKIS